MKDEIKTIAKGTEKTGNAEKTGKIKPSNNVGEIVAVRDYVASKGYNGIVQWDGENPTVAGVKVKPLEIKNGTAYVMKADVDSILGNMETGAGVVGAKKARDEKYAKAENDAFSAIVNRKPFSYDVENDAAYQAYKKQYEREAEHALRRILNDNNTSIAGASGAVLSDAMAAQSDELEKITDVIPELYGDAYKRYMDETDLVNNTFKTINDAANEYYDRMYKSDSDIKERINASGKAEREERQRQVENERNEQNDIREQALKEIELRLRADELASDITKSRVSTESAAMDNAIARGFFIESDEEIMPWLKEYRSTNGTYTILPSVASIAYEYQAAHERERAKINAKLGR